jgi:hypothetical protein
MTVARSIVSRLNVSLPVGVSLDHFNGLENAAFERTCPKNSSPTQDGVYRCAQLVRQRCQELLLQAIGVLGLSEQLNAIDGNLKPFALRRGRPPILEIGRPFLVTPAIDPLIIPHSRVLKDRGI